MSHVDSHNSGYRDIFKFPSSVDPAEAAVGVNRISRQTAWRKKKPSLITKHLYAQPRGLIQDRAGLTAFLAPYEETLKNLKQFERITPEWEIKTHRMVLAPLVIGVKKLLRRMLRGFVASGWERQSIHNRKVKLLIDNLLCEIAILRAEVGKLKGDLSDGRMEMHT